MLSGVDPILTGELLTHLDAMGHSDSVVISDAHFPAQRLSQRVVILPGLLAPDVTRAIRTVLPLDDTPAVSFMASASEEVLPIHAELAQAADVADADVQYLAREDFYSRASESFLVIRTGETRAYGNVLLRKGLVMPIARALRAASRDAGTASATPVAQQASGHEGQA